MPDILAYNRTYQEAIAEEIANLGLNVSRCVQFCAAKILNVLERWTDFKLGKKMTEWVFMAVVRTPSSSPESEAKRTSFKEELGGEYGKHAIRQALNLLIDLRLIERRHNPFNQQDRIYQYRLKDRLKALLHPIVCQQTLQVHPQTLEGYEQTSITTRIGSKIDSNKQTNQSNIVVSNKNYLPEKDQTNQTLRSEMSSFKPKVEDETHNPSSQKIKCTTSNPPQSLKEDLSLEPECKEKLSGKISELGAPPDHPVIQRLLAQTPGSVAEAAVDVALDWVKRKRVSGEDIVNPIGVVIEALKDGWTLDESQPAQLPVCDRTSQEPDYREVRDWLDFCDRTYSAFVDLAEASDWEGVRSHIADLQEKGFTRELAILREFYPGWGDVEEELERSLDYAKDYTNLD